MAREQDRQSRESWSNGEEPGHEAQELNNPGGMGERQARGEEGCARGKEKDFCTGSPWQELELELVPFPGWMARTGAALGFGVPQLTVKAFSDSERSGLSQL